MKTVGIVGLGTMGFPMACNLIDAGYNVVSTVHRNPTPAERLKAKGATLVEAPQHVGSASDVTIFILPADAEVRAAAFGPNGICHGDLKGKTIIDMTTTTPGTVMELEKELGRCGAGVLDAPVSGGRSGAEKGELTIMVGGEESLLKAHQDLLEVLGSRIYHVGDVGSGKSVKLINQLLNATHMVALSEALVLAEKAGVDLDRLMSVLKESSGYSKVMDLKYERFIRPRDFSPSFKLSLMHKDVKLGIETGDALSSPLVLASQAYQFYKGCIAQGDHDKDYSVVFDFISQMSQASELKFRPGSQVE